METYVLAGGCFWCLDAAYRQLRGVEAVECGYTGGGLPHPSYQQVCTGATGHAEAVRVTFDPAVIPLEVVLDAFFTMHNPTTLNRQGADVGTQYRSAMYWATEAQRAEFRAAIGRAAEAWDAPVVTELTQLGPWYPAEEYHQDYFAKNPTQGYCQAVVAGKVAKVRAEFVPYLRER